jgi:hypothetical protein
VIRHLDQWLFKAAPSSRLATLRILCGLYATIFLIARAPSFWSTADLPARQVEGVGILWFLDGPLSASVFQLTFVFTIVLGVAFTLGWQFRLAGPTFSLLFLFVATYRLSFGHVIHTEHLIALHLLVLGFTRSGDALSLSHRVQENGAERQSAVYGWPIQIMILLTVITYVLAGISKVQHGGWDWLTGDVLRNQVAYDNLRKELLGSPHSPIGGWLIRFGWLFPPAAIATSIVEIGAFVALANQQRLRWIFALSAWAFHVGVVLTMAISFPYPLSFVAYAPLFAVEQIWSTKLVTRLLRRKTYL